MLVCSLCWWGVVLVAGVVVVVARFGCFVEIGFVTLVGLLFSVLVFVVG